MRTLELSRLHACYVRLLQEQQAQMRAFWLNKIHACYMRLLHLLAS